MGLPSPDSGKTMLAPAMGAPVSSITDTVRSYGRGVGVAVGSGVGVQAEAVMVAICSAEGPHPLKRRSNTMVPQRAYLYFMIDLLVVEIFDDRETTGIFVRDLLSLLAYQPGMLLKLLAHNIQQ